MGPAASAPGRKAMALGTLGHLFWSRTERFLSEPGWRGKDGVSEAQGSSVGIREGTGWGL